MRVRGLDGFGRSRLASSISRGRVFGNPAAQTDCGCLVRTAAPGHERDPRLQQGSPALLKFDGVDRAFENLAIADPVSFQRSISKRSSARRRSGSIYPSSAAAIPSSNDTKGCAGLCARIRRWNIAHTSRNKGSATQSSIADIASLTDGSLRMTSSLLLRSGANRDERPVGRFNC